MIGRKSIFWRIFQQNSFAMSRTDLSVDLEQMKTANKRKHEVSKDEMFFKEPFGLFKNWYDEACDTPGIIEPRAMCLATCTRSALPSARFVILRGYGTDGFKFFTNYCSRKGEELHENPNAALVFYWECLRKSIRIEGSVEKLSEEESTRFFYSRPRKYQIEAAFSDQSQPISSRVSLGEKEKKFKEQYENCDFIPKPKDWGGYILKPHAVEFWKGQSDSLHDRIRFRILKEYEVIDNILLHQGENGWVYERLQP